jgi:8-oxo-dGTP diphosphatase
VTVYLVRHGAAGHRHDWAQPDDLRPLTAKGQRQAKGLIDTLGERPIERVLTSPTTRCVQTVEPLAAHLGVDVEVSGALMEGAPLSAVLTLVDSLVDENAVLCTHGDVVPEVLRALVGRGMRIVDPEEWRKGSTWVLEAGGDGFAVARYLPPPD